MPKKGIDSASVVREGDVSNDAVKRVMCHTQPSVDRGFRYSMAASFRDDCLRWLCGVVVRLARKARRMASRNQAEERKVRACLVSFGVPAQSVSRIIGVSPPTAGEFGLTYP